MYGIFIGVNISGFDHFKSVKNSKYNKGRKIHSNLSIVKNIIACMNKTIRKCQTNRIIFSGFIAVYNNNKMRVACD